MWGAGATSMDGVRFFETREAALAYLACALDNPVRVGPHEFETGSAA